MHTITTSQPTPKQHFLYIYPGERSAAHLPSTPSLYFCCYPPSCKIFSLVIYIGFPFSTASNVTFVLFSSERVATVRFPYLLPSSRSSLCIPFSCRLSLLAYIQFRAKRLKIKVQVDSIQAANGLERYSLCAQACVYVIKRKRTSFHREKERTREQSSEWGRQTRWSTPRALRSFQAVRCSTRSALHLVPLVKALAASLPKPP